MCDETQVTDSEKSSVRTSVSDYSYYLYIE